MIDIEILHSQQSQSLYSHQRGQNINTCQQAIQVLLNGPLEWSVFIIIDFWNVLGKGGNRFCEKQPRNSGALLSKKLIWVDNLRTFISLTCTDLFSRGQNYNKLLQMVPE